MKSQTLGQKRVRVSFNPSEKNLIDEIKANSAACIDKVNTVACVDGEQGRLKSLAMTAYEDAAMWAVKAATYKV